VGSGRPRGGYGGRASQRRCGLSLDRSKRWSAQGLPSIAQSAGLSIAVADLVSTPTASAPRSTSRSTNSSDPQCARGLAAGDPRAHHVLRRPRDHRPRPGRQRRVFRLARALIAARWRLRPGTLVCPSRVRDVTGGGCRLGGRSPPAPRLSRVRTDTPIAEFLAGFCSGRAVPPGHGRDEAFTVRQHDATIPVTADRASRSTTWAMQSGNYWHHRVAESILLDGLLATIKCLAKNCLLISPRRALACAAMTESRAGRNFLIATSDRCAARKPWCRKLVC
jgi:hypothetical protein